MTDAFEQRLSDLLNDIEINCDPGIGGGQCNAFSIECLFLIQHKLPPIAVEALGILNDYLAGRIPVKSVLDALVGLWKYLDTNHPQRGVDNLEISAIRAVIFPLDAQKSPEMRNIVDHLGFFLQFVNNVEPHYEEEEVLLRKHFGECLTVG